MNSYQVTYEDLFILFPLKPLIAYFSHLNFSSPSTYVNGELIISWAQGKPTLSGKLRQVESEVDETVLSAFTTLTEHERRFIVQRTKEFPLNQVLVRDEPGVSTKQLPVKYWKTGERYRV